MLGLYPQDKENHMEKQTHNKIETGIMEGLTDYLMSGPGVSVEGLISVRLQRESRTINAGNYLRCTVLGNPKPSQAATLNP